jgi:hypothetical protein
MSDTVGLTKTELVVTGRAKWHRRLTHCYTKMKGARHVKRLNGGNEHDNPSPIMSLHK